MRHARIPLFLFLLFVIAAAWPHSAPAAPRAETAASEARAASVAIEIRAQARGRLKKFYASRGFWPLWASAGKIGPEAQSLIGFLETAELDGLKSSTYKVDDLREAMESARGGDPRQIARAELKLSKAFARYASDMRRSPKVEMAYGDEDLKPKKLRDDEVLRAAALPESFKDYVASMEWMSPHYLRVRKLLAQSVERGGSEEERRRLRLNLERTRVLPGPWTRHIVVDSASGRLWYYQAGKQQGMMKVVVGTPETQTPMLAGTLHYAILNPYWNVPVSLAQKSIAKKVLSGRSLKAMGMEVLSDWSASPRVLPSSSVDWTAVAAGTQQVRLRQLPGPDNSMGRAKFLFPNDEGIYLHDTPDKNLMAKRDRHLSNGCIRLEDARRLGKWLLGRPIKAASKEPEQVVALPVGVPVYLTYVTATPTEKGIGFLNDVYNRDL